MIKTRFELTHEVIEPAAEAKRLRNTVCGAYVAFEGWVRNENEGKAVSALHYEAYPELATTEGTRLLEDVLKKHDCLGAHCIHRLGTLELGETAVWAGVVAPHRAAAFAACAEILDLLKHRVPIWKREIYAEGPPTWLNPGST